MAQFPYYTMKKWGYSDTHRCFKSLCTKCCIFTNTQIFQESKLLLIFRIFKFCFREIWMSLNFLRWPTQSHSQLFSLIHLEEPLRITDRKEVFLTPKGLLSKALLQNPLYLFLQSSPRQGSGHISFSLIFLPISLASSSSLSQKPVCLYLAK